MPALQLLHEFDLQHRPEETVEGQEGCAHNYGDILLPYENTHSPHVSNQTGLGTCL